MKNILTGIMLVSSSTLMVKAQTADALKKQVTSLQSENTSFTIKMAFLKKRTTISGKHCE